MATLKQHPSFTENFRTASMYMYRQIIDHKLDAMAEHFHLTWGEPVENWAGPEGGFHDKYGGTDQLVLVGLLVLLVLGLVHACS